MNETMNKFGYPDTLIKEYEHWVVLLRPEQITLASLVLVHKGDCRKMSEMESEEFLEYGAVIKDIEGTLIDLFAAEKFNHLLFMMVDPNVHFHVLPRYGKERSFAGTNFIDSDWPNPPNLSKKLDMESAVALELKNHLKAHWK